MQIGAELLCKSAKVRLNFQVSGLGSREPGSGVQVRVQVQDLNVTPHPHLYLITRTRDLRAETWDLKLPFTCAQAAGRFALCGVFTACLYSKGYSSPSAKKLWASRRREQPSAVTKVMSLPVAEMRRHQEGSFDP